MHGRMFSDSWHLVADKRACLLPSVEVTKEYFRGQPWYILHAPFNNELFRLSPPAYRFVARLRMDKTIDEAWRQTVEKDPEEAPGQEEVVQVLAQLNQGNLIHSDIAADSQQLFQSQRKRRRRMLQMQLINFLFLRIPLFNPNRFLDYVTPLGKLFINPVALLVWLGTVAWAVKGILENFDKATDQASGFLAPDNLLLVFACTVVLKALHELAHGIACKHYGGDVPSFGIMLILLAPLPYVDATSSWGFRNKWQRIAVSAAGMYAEFFVAALAAIVWVETGDGTLNAVAYNVMLIASVSTLLFNLNPLLKFDGYYLFADFFELPNLQQRSHRMLKFLLEKYAFGCREPLNPAVSKVEGAWLSSYAIAAAIYRVFLMTTIALLVGERFFEIGLLIAGFTVINYLVLPVFKFLYYVGTAKELIEHRARAWSVVVFVAALLIAGLGLLPLPEHTQEPGMIRARTLAQVHTEAAGRVVERLVSPGDKVDAGTPLLRLENRDLDTLIRQSELRLRQAQARFESTSGGERSTLAPLREMIRLEEQKVMQLRERRDHLLVKAEMQGVWSSPEWDALDGQWLQRGSRIGMILGDDGFEFVGVISQQEAAHLFSQTIDKVEIRLWGEAEHNIPPEAVTITPSRQQELPSPVLGWMGGGEVEISQDDPQGKQAIEPFFIITALLPDNTEATLLQERTGKLRLRVGKRPLYRQWYHDVRQLLQKRLEI